MIVAASLQPAAPAAVEAGDPPGLACSDFEVGRRCADVLGGDEAPAETLHGATLRKEELLAIEGLRGSEDHGLATTERETGQGVLVRHAARQAQCVDERVRGRGVGPQPCATRCRAQCSGVQGDDRPVAAGRILTEDDLLMPERDDLLEWGHAHRS